MIQLSGGNAFHHQVQERIDSERRPVAGWLRAKRQDSMTDPARGLKPCVSIPAREGNLTILGRSNFDLWPASGVRSGSY